MRGRFKSKTYYNVMRNVLFQRLSPLVSAIKYVEKLPHFEQSSTEMKNGLCNPFRLCCKNTLILLRFILKCY